MYLHWKDNKSFYSDFVLVCIYLPLVSVAFQEHKMYIDGRDFLNNTELFIQSPPVTRLGVLAAKIAYYNFDWRYVTLVMFNTMEIFGLQSFLVNYNKTVVVKMGRVVPKRRVHVPQIVIFGQQAVEISTTIRWLVRMKYDSNAKFVIICSSPNQDCDETKIFDTFLKSLVLNVIVLKRSYVTNEPLAFTYKIILPTKCENGESEKIDLVSDCHDDKCFANLFPGRLTNFYKCRFIISTIEQPPFMYLHNGTKELSGTDGDIMKLAADMLNATLELKTPRDIHDAGRYSNNNWTGSLGDIYNKRAHASVCTIPLTSYNYGNFTISFTYHSMDMVWAAKLPSEKAPWEKLLYPFKFWVRIIILFTFIGIIFMNILKDTNIWRKVRRAFQLGQSNYNLLFYSWLLFLGMPLLKFPTKKSLRIVLFTWIYYCFVVRSAYQAALINSLKNPAYLAEYATLRDVIKDGSPFGGLSSLRDFYYEDRTIYDKWKNVELEDVYRTLDEIFDGTSNFVLASNKEIVKYKLKKHNGTKQLQIIPEKIVNSPTVVYLSKYSPVSSPLSYVLRVALEAGFIQRIHRRYLDTDAALLRRYETKKPEPLNMYHFAGCFAILIIGWILSIIYFAVEFICGNLNEQ